MSRLQLTAADGSPDPDLVNTFAYVKSVIGKDRDTGTLYRALGNAPKMMNAWLGMAWPLRSDALSPRSTRELVILRMSQIEGAVYEWAHHWSMAKNAGVTEEQILALHEWRRSDLFSDAERTALALTEEIGEGAVTDETWSAVADRFPPAECVELVLTASFYVMCSRVIKTLKIEPEPGYEDIVGKFYDRP